MTSSNIESRAAVHAALGDPLRLAIVDELVLSDRSPAELAARFDISSNLLAHHLDLLIDVGLAIRIISHGDRRRRYIRLVADPLEATQREATLRTGRTLRVDRVVFVCTANSARSQFARAAWCAKRTDIPATSGGTQPAGRVHPRAVRAARRADTELHRALHDVAPQPIPTLGREDLVVTVCDRAHEHLTGTPRRAVGPGTEVQSPTAASADAPAADFDLGQSSFLHWSVPDPVDDGDFDGALAEVRQRVENLSRHVMAAERSTKEKT